MVKNYQVLKYTQNQKEKLKFLEHIRNKEVSEYLTLTGHNGVKMDKGGSGPATGYGCAKAWRNECGSKLSRGTNLAKGYRG